MPADLPLYVDLALMWTWQKNPFIISSLIYLSSSCLMDYLLVMENRSKLDLPFVDYCRLMSNV